MKKTSVLIIEDHQLMAEAWKLLLESRTEFDFVHFFKAADEAMPFIKFSKPDIILLDVNLPRISGIDATSKILSIAPGSRIIGLSIYTLPAYAQQMLSNGAYGYVTKSSSAEELLKAMTEVLNGNKYVCNEIRDALSKELLEDAALAKPTPKLSKREKEVIRYLKQGLTSRQIGVKMEISDKTVEVHRYNILRKLNLNNTAALLDFIRHYDPLI